MSGEVQLQVRLGDLVSAQQVSVVIGVRCPAVNAGGQVSVSARLADKDQALFAQPMTIEWAAVDADANAVQVVNNDVLIQAGRLMAERARAGALDANRRGDYRTRRASSKPEPTACARSRQASELEALAAELEADEQKHAPDGPDGHEAEPLRELRQRDEPEQEGERGGSEGELRHQRCRAGPLSFVWAGPVLARPVDVLLDVGVVARCRAYCLHHRSDGGPFGLQA
jgi:hypothetical protein